MPKLEENKLKEILVRPGYLAPEDFELAKKEAKDKVKSIEEILIEKDLISDEQLGQLIATEFGYNFINLRKEAISEEVINIVPEIVARNQGVIVFDKIKEGLKVAMSEPENLEMADWLERKTGEKIQVFYATNRDIALSLKYYRKELKKTFEDIILEQTELVKNGKVRAEDLPIIKIFDTLVEYGYENRASDIHIEPLEGETKVRFRIDGVLHNVLTLPKEIHGLMVTRVKVLAKLRTDEHSAAQDGRFSVKFGAEKFDIRVSVVPIEEGEKVVLRLLSERARRFNLEDLGMGNSDLKKVKTAIKKPFGMILATGPTGCGKTTTLYAILKILNKPEVNICTIEDPVEYDIEGISQIQVNPKTNLTFSQGLRAIVRQDPDIIMVGEIRDSETAGIAINSSMTGHLVLSTMHANTASTNIPRLIDMGIEPFLIASSVNIIISQRLVRKICTKCRESYEITRDELKEQNLSEQIIEKIFKGKETVRVYRGRGCKVCIDTGYNGRTGIFEVLEMAENIKKLITLKATADEIENQAIQNGMTTMLDDGIEKVLTGLTTIEEVIRVTRE